jgi:cysteine desulfurase/selenocysteine lyase
MSFNPYKIREDFPILSEKIHNHPLVYFDNGATTQKPEEVIKVIRDFYTSRNSSIHRGIHYLSEQATEDYEDARRTVKEFIGSAHAHEIIFTAGTTASINAIAFSFGEKFIRAGDEILITAMEHHANIVPWQMLCERKSAHLKVLPMNQEGELQMEMLDNLLTPKTRLLAVTHVSNTLGTINPLREIIARSHQKGIPVLADGAQAIQHGQVNVQDLDCDFYVFSGHKVYGPTGIGVLYGKEKWLEQIPPYQGGGDMVQTVTFEKTTYNELPFKFEAGTTHFTGAIGLAAALKYIRNIGLEEIASYEKELLTYATDSLLKIDGLTIYGKARNKISILSFLIDKIHPYDAGMILDKMGIAIRTGTHCAQPVMQFFGIEGTMRASLVFYNLKDEIDILVEGLQKARKMLL